MGFNISGLGINSSYENKIRELENDLNLTLEYVEDVIFEKASSNWTEEGVGYLFCTKNSTLLFLHMDLCTEPYAIEEKQVLTFALSETSMAFCLNYSIGKDVKRYIMEHNGEKMSEEGVPFTFEATCGDTSEIIWKQLDEVLDVPFNSIDLGATAKKFQISIGKTASNGNDDDSNKQDIGSKEHQNKLESKYKRLSDDELFTEFSRIANIPNARTNIQCLVEVSALMSVAKERGIDIQKPKEIANNDKKGCMPILLLGLLIVASIISYAI